MGTHPIFESDFDCLTDMRFTRPVLAAARAARTEYRTPAIKEKYTPGKTFGFLPAPWPAYLFCFSITAYEIISHAYYNYLMMEGAVARSSIARRIELDREPDLGIVDLWGRRNQPENKPRKFEMYNKLLFTAQHPKYVLDTGLMCIYNAIWCGWTRFF